MSFYTTTRVEQRWAQSNDTLKTRVMDRFICCQILQRNVNWLVLTCVGRTVTKVEFQMGIFWKELVPVENTPPSYYIYMGFPRNCKHTYSSTGREII